MDNQLPKNEKVIKDQLQNVDAPDNKPIFKRKVISLALIGILLLLLVGLFMFMSKNISKNKMTEQTSTKKYALPGVVTFEPASINVIPNQKSSVDISINTGGNEVRGLIIAITYNPNIVGDVKLTQVKDPQSALSSTFMTIGKVTYDPTGGALITLRLPESTPSLKGIGKVATLTFVPKKINVAIPTAYITFSPLTNFIVNSGSPFIKMNYNRVSLNYLPNTSSSVDNTKFQK